jgi:hypothetical protein
MGFKVVSCYDFTVAEMKNAVTFFASLLMEGVYGKPREFSSNDILIAISMAEFDSETRG